MTTSDTPRRRWPVWPWLVLVVAGVAVTAAAALVGAANRPAAGSEPGVKVTVTVTRVSTVFSTATVTLPPPPGPATLITDGLHDVGVNVQPGRYQTAGASGANPGGCFWSRATSGGTVIDNGVLSGPGTITINANELIDTNGCQVWHKIP